jgi:natural product precursor
MKSKVKFNQKLSLNKETIAKMNEKQMNKVAGGKNLLTSSGVCYTSGGSC